MKSAFLHPSETVVQNILREQDQAMKYNIEKSKSLMEITDRSSIKNDTKSFRKFTNGKFRIGYIVATCSPTTRAHIELAKQAIDDLGLSHVYFILWPFHYIRGFHANPLEEWIDKERHIDHGHRERILSLSIMESRVSASEYKESLELYKQSELHFDKNEKNSYFWTGTWFVIRNLQRQVIHHLGVSDDKVEFFFICGEDQFNPNIYSLIEGDTSEKVWKDYSIAQHLLLHNVYAVPRGSYDDTIERFEVFDGRFANKIIIAERITNSNISATKIRNGSAEPLESYCYMSACEYIRAHNFWNYGNTRPKIIHNKIDEIYEPLRKFLDSKSIDEDTIIKDNIKFKIWAKPSDYDSDEKYCILYQPESKPYFRKYYLN